MKVKVSELQNIIESVWQDQTLLRNLETKAAIDRVIELLDKGQLRCAEPDGKGGRTTYDWIRKAIILYFPTRELHTFTAGELEFYDKIDIKKNLKELGSRVVPPAIIRYGSYVSRGGIIMPSFVNIGAYVGEGTMLDTWSSVGSCAQVGRWVHIGAGVSIGGALDFANAKPVMIEDDCYIGARSVLTHSVLIGSESIIGAGTVLTATTRIIDVTGEREVESTGYIPESSVVINGTVSREYASGSYGVPCALIVGKRRKDADKKSTLNEAINKFGISI